MEKIPEEFPKTLVLIPPKKVSYQTQLVLIPCPPHRITPLSKFQPLSHKTETDKMVSLKQQVITPKFSPRHKPDNSQLPLSGHQKKTEPLVNKKNRDKLSQQNKFERPSYLLFKNKVPHIGILCPGDHQTNISITLSTGGNKFKDTSRPSTSSQKAKVKPGPRSLDVGKVTCQSGGKKLKRDTVTTAYNRDPYSKVTTTKKQSSVLNPVARDQAWKNLHSDLEGKYNLGSKEQANLKDAPHQVNNVQLSPDDQSPHLLNRHQKIPTPGSETKVKKQLNKRNWAKSFQGCDIQTLIPLNQHQSKVTQDCVYEDSFPLKHTHIKPEGPMHTNMIHRWQRKSRPFFPHQAESPPCYVCSSRPQPTNSLSNSDCWPTLPVVEHHSVHHLNPVPKKFTLHPKSYYQAKTKPISHSRDEKQYQIQTEQNNRTPRWLDAFKPYTTEGSSRTKNFIEDISPRLKSKIKSDFSNQLHIWQKKDYPGPLSWWPRKYISPDDDICLACSSWIPINHSHIERRATVPTSLTDPKKNVRFFIDVLQSNTNTTLKPPGALSSRLAPLHPSPDFPSCSHSDSVPWTPLRTKFTWLDFIRNKHHQTNDKKISPSQKLVWEEIPFTSKTTIRKVSVRPNTYPMSLLKKFERRVNN